MGYKRRVAKKQMVVRAINRKKRINWCKERKNWTVERQWSKWIFSDECQIVLGQNNKIFIWRKADEVDSPHLVCPPSQKKISVMVWGCLSFHGMGTLTALEGNIDSQK